MKQHGVLNRHMSQKKIRDTAQISGSDATAYITISYIYIYIFVCVCVCFIYIYVYKEKIAPTNMYVNMLEQFVLSHQQELQRNICSNKKGHFQIGVLYETFP